MDNNSSISSSVQLQQRQWVNPDQVMMRRAKKKRGCRPLVDQDQNSCLTEDRREQEVSSGTSLVFRKPKKHEGSSPLRKKFYSSVVQDNSSKQMPKLLDSSIATSDTVPTDWSIKTRARFTSILPFTWAASPRGKEEADGLAMFVKRPLDTPKLENVGAASSSASASWISQLLSCQLLWMHPSLPFLNLFPRYDTKQITTNQSLFSGQNERLADTLRDDWAASFQSLFQLLQADHCSHFYLCANQFTVLFLSRTSSSSGHATALLTPTTSGLRQAMQCEGVEFSLPAGKLSTSTSCTSMSQTISSKDPSDDSDDETILAEDDTAANRWLHSIGLPLSGSEEPFLSSSSDQSGISFQHSRSSSVADNKPASVVKVVGSNVHALFNFLLNCKTIVASTGTHAGVPPTLLSPVPFLGGALRSLSAKQATVQQVVEGKLTPLHTLDVSGPLLPYTVTRICSLLRKTQSGDFTVQFSTAESTVAFNQREETNGDSTSSYSSHTRSTIRELKCREGLYTCTLR